MHTSDEGGFEDELCKRLLREGDLCAADLERARYRQASRGCGLTTALIDLGLVAEPRLQELRAEILGAPEEPEESELISQGSFEEIYQTPQRALPPSGRLDPLRPGEVRTPGVRQLTIKPQPSQAEPEAPAAAAPAEAPGDAASQVQAGGKTEPAEDAVPTLDLVETVAHWRGNRAEEVRPLDELAEVRALLDRATSQREVGWVLARAALGKAQRVVLLRRRGRAWVGWTGAGPGIRAERVGRLVVPPVKGSVFGLVAETGAHFLGPLVDHPVHDRFYRTLDVPPAKTAGLFPVHQSGRVEMAIFLDGGPEGQLGEDVGEVLLIAMEVPRVLARLASEGASD